MITEPVTPQRLAASVIAVPPLARRPDLSLNPEANGAMIRHIEAGGVTTLLYGGNANLYHVPLSEYAGLLEMIADLAAPDTLVIPSVGPAYGMMMDQAAILRSTDFPTAMVLPQPAMTTPAGVETGIRRFAEALGRPVVLYIKEDGFIGVEGARQLADDGLLSWIKYAVVRDDPADDEYLRRLVDAVDPQIIVSGVGEQPAIIHMRAFGLVGFTAGGVCVAPSLAAEMLRAIHAGDFDRADRMRAMFCPLENLRVAIHPVRVLHDAVTLAGIADMGPVLPLLSNVDAADRPAVQTAARGLLGLELDARRTGAVL